MDLATEFFSQWSLLTNTRNESTPVPRRTDENDGRPTDSTLRSGGEQNCPPTGPQEEKVRKKLKTMPVCWISRPVATEPTSAASAWHRPDGRSKSSDLVTGSKVNSARSDGGSRNKTPRRMITISFFKSKVDWPKAAKVRAFPDQMRQLSAGQQQKWQATLDSLVAPNTTHETADFLGRVPARILG